MDMSALLWAGSFVFGVCLLVLVVRIEWFWQRHKLWAEAAAALNTASILFVFATGWPLWVQIALFICQAWFVLLALRVVFGRLEQQFIKRSTGLNVVIGIGAVMHVIVMSFLPIQLLTTFILLLDAAVAVLLLRQIFWTLRKFTVPPGQLNLKELPTVSVCIPARNEDKALTECLEAVLRSDYPKMEVLVYDDCSQDKTAQMVRDFAHAGVRFIEGRALDVGWLGKNQAMAMLAEHASGDFILFMSVDTILAPQSLSKLVHFALRNRLAMVSVLPQNELGPHVSTLFAPLHYTWHMVLPLGPWHVPVSSKGWLINADILKQLGGFAAVKRSIVPEAVFARQLRVSNGYRFIVSEPSLGITTAKKWHSQVRTMLRIIYPTHHRQPFLLLARMVGVVSGFVLPLVLLFITPIMSLQFWLSAVVVLLFFVCYSLVVSRTHPGSWWLSMWFLPVVVMQDVGLAFVSMLAYEFSEVLWKGRNVCYPVVKVSGPFERRGL